MEWIFWGLAWAICVGVILSILRWAHDRRIVGDRAALLALDPNGYYGRLAYTAYCLSTHWKSAVTGDPLPSWESQSDAIRDAWIAAAAAVREIDR